MATEREQIQQLAEAVRTQQALIMSLIEQLGDNKVISYDRMHRDRVRWLAWLDQEVAATAAESAAAANQEQGALRSLLLRSPARPAGHSEVIPNPTLMAEVEPAWKDEALQEYNKLLRQHLPGQPINLCTNNGQPGFKQGFLLVLTPAELAKARSSLPAAVKGYPLYWRPLHKPDSTPLLLHTV
jgi:hypothetical protein